METPTADDLLQFRDYSVNNSGTPAQINVNSPTHATNSGGGVGSGNAGAAGNAQRQRGDPLADLIYDMSNSAQSMSGGGGGSGGAGSSQGASFDETGGTGSGSGTRLSFLTIEYYQQFFNVDTYMVLERIANSMIPKRAAANYLRMNIGENPDLYGPFWITVTLVCGVEQLQCLLTNVCLLPCRSSRLQLAAILPAICSRRTTATIGITISIWSPMQPPAYFSTPTSCRPYSGPSSSTASSRWMRRMPLKQIV